MRVGRVGITVHRVAANTTPPPPPREPPWMAGLRAARANVLPALMVQGVMLALLLAYYFYPPTTLWLDRLAMLKQHWGYGYSAVAAIIAGALIPEILRIAVFQHGRFHARNLRNLIFTVPFWGMMGLIVDLLYRSQAVWFGDSATIPVVAKKVLVDQFVYNPLFAAPVTVWLYDWKHRGYRFAGLGGLFKAGYYRDAVLPVLFAGWGVWIPVVSILYSMPSRLQVPMFALALSLWVVLYTWMSEHRAGTQPAAPPHA